MEDPERVPSVDKQRSDAGDVDGDREQDGYGEHRVAAPLQAEQGGLRAPEQFAGEQHVSDQNALEHPWNRTRRGSRCEPRRGAFEARCGRAHGLIINRTVWVT